VRVRKESQKHFSRKRKTRVLGERERNLEEAKRRGRGRIHFL